MKSGEAKQHKQDHNTSTTSKTLEQHRKNKQNEKKEKIIRGSLCLTFPAGHTGSWHDPAKDQASKTRKAKWSRQSLNNRPDLLIKIEQRIKQK